MDKWVSSARNETKPRHTVQPRASTGHGLPRVLQDLPQRRSGDDRHCRRRPGFVPGCGCRVGGDRRPRNPVRPAPSPGPPRSPRLFSTRTPTHPSDCILRTPYDELPSSNRPEPADTPRRGRDLQDHFCLNGTQSGSRLGIGCLPIPGLTCWFFELEIGAERTQDHGNRRRRMFAAA